MIEKIAGKEFRFKVDSESEDTIPAIRKLKKRIERLNAWPSGFAKYVMGLRLAGLPE